MLRTAASIMFATDEATNALNVLIATERLSLESVTLENLNDYSLLFGNADVMTKYGDSKIWNATKAKARVETWVKRWNENDPFSAFAVFKNDDDKFIGHVALGYGDEPGQSELAYVFAKPMWGNGYGKEAVSAVVKDYAPELVERNFQLEGKPFTSIVATTRPDNEASFKILNSVGMKSIKEEVKYGHNRNIFFITTAELRSQRVNDSVELVNTPKPV